MGDDTADQRVYTGFIWIGEEPGVRFSVEARSLDEARAQVVSKYGEGVVSMRNDDDARSTR